MSEFKGTKGNWNVKKRTDYPTLHDIWSDKDSCLTNGTLIARTSYATHSEANALLMSKAPQMLEMLKNISKQMEISWRRYDNGEDYHLEQIFDDIDLEELDNLIKEATELK